MEKSISTDNEGDPHEIWSGVVYPVQTEATYGLGLCGDGVIIAKQQEELDRDVESLIANRAVTVAVAKHIALD